MLLASKAWSRYDAAPNPLLLSLQRGRKQPISWLWRRKAKIRGISIVNENGVPNLKKYLRPKENTLLVHLKEEIDRAKEVKQPPKGYVYADGRSLLCFRSL